MMFSSSSSHSGRVDPVVVTVCHVDEAGHGGGSKVGHGLQSAKHLDARLASFRRGLLASLGPASRSAYPPYIIPQSLMPSQQTVRVLQSSDTLEVGGSVGVAVALLHGGGDGAESGSHTS